uniref:Uncharacterized protein n=1 Tax=Arundo donax TaxID=35708 RepID=A0A0A9A8Y7_ARUDO
MKLVFSASPARHYNNYSVATVANPKPVQPMPKGP